MTDEKKEEKRITPKDYWMSEPFAEMRRMLDHSAPHGGHP